MSWPLMSTGSSLPILTRSMSFLWAESRPVRRVPVMKSLAPARSLATTSSLRGVVILCSAMALDPDSELGLLDGLLHALDGLLQLGLFLVVELDLEDLLHALGADHGRHAQDQPLDAVLAIAQGGAGQAAALVAEVGLGHDDRAPGGAEEGRPLADKLHDL